MGTSAECGGQWEMQTGMPRILARRVNTNKVKTRLCLAMEAFLLSSPRHIFFNGAIFYQACTPVVPGKFECIGRITGLVSGYNLVS